MHGAIGLILPDRVSYERELQRRAWARWEIERSFRLGVVPARVSPRVSPRRVMVEADLFG